MNCKDCWHYKPCFSGGKSIWSDIEQTEDDHCPYFADSSRFIELPCKVGDTVYHITSVFNDATLKSEKIIQKRIGYVSSFSFIAGCRGMIFSEADFGKTVFLTKEGAEQALKEREEANNV